MMDKVLKSCTCVGPDQLRNSIDHSYLGNDRTYYRMSGTKLALIKITGVISVKRDMVMPT